MAKRVMKEALGASLRAEQQATTDRFARAEAYFDTREHRPAPAAAPPAREKVIRDGFTMPVGDHALIAQVQAIGLQAGLHVTKSEVLRAGLHALLQSSPDALQQLLLAVEKVKTGRPAK
jgi:hypothetical protein